MMLKLIHERRHESSWSRLICVRACLPICHRFIDRAEDGRCVALLAAKSLVFPLLLQYRGVFVGLRDMHRKTPLSPKRHHQSLVQTVCVIACSQWPPLPSPPKHARKRESSQRIS